MCSFKNQKNVLFWMHYCSFIYQIFREIIHCLPGEWLHVQFVAADFDKALWGAHQSVVPHVKLQGCPLDWTQLVWKKVNWILQVKLHALVSSSELLAPAELWHEAIKLFDQPSHFLSATLTCSYSFTLTCTLPKSSGTSLSCRGLFFRRKWLIISPSGCQNINCCQSFFMTTLTWTIRSY